MKNSIGAMNNVHSFDFCFLITYGVCKKRKYCNRMSEKKKFSPFDECSCFVNLKRQKEQKKNFVRLSVCPSVFLDVHTYVDFSCGHNNFRRSQRIQTKFGGCLLCMKCSSGLKLMCIAILRDCISPAVRKINNLRNFSTGQLLEKIIEYILDTFY